MRFSNYEYEQIKDSIAIGDLRHYPPREICKFVEGQTGIKIKLDTFYKIRSRLKHETEQRFIELVRSKYDYQHEIMKSLEEKERLLSAAWDEFTTVEEGKERIICLKVIDQIQNSKYQIIKDMPDIVIGARVTEEAIMNTNDDTTQTQSEQTKSKSSEADGQPLY